MTRATLLVAVACLAALVACGDLKEQSGDSDGLDAEGAQHLVIGGGLSETLGVLSVRPDGSFDYAGDVAKTGSAISAAAPRGGDLYAVCSLSNSVVVYDAKLNVRREVSVGENVNPISLAFVDDHLAWVTGGLSNDVRLVDLGPGVAAGERVLHVTALPAGEALPRDAGVAQSWARPAAIVAVGDEVLAVLGNLDAGWRAAGPSLVVVLGAAGGQLRGVIELEGRDAAGAVYDAERGVVWIASAGDHATGSGFVGNGLLEAVDPTTREIVRTIEVDAAPFEVLIGPSGLAYLGNGRDGRVLVVDLETGETTATVDLRRHVPESGLSFVSALALDAAGLVYATDFNSDYLYVIDPAADHAIIHEQIVVDGPDTLTFLD